METYEDVNNSTLEDFELRFEDLTRVLEQRLDSRDKGIYILRCYYLDKEGQIIQMYLWSSDDTPFVYNPSIITPDFFVHEYRQLDGNRDIEYVWII